MATSLPNSLGSVSKMTVAPCKRGYWLESSGICDCEHRVRFLVPQLASSGQVGRATFLERSKNGHDPSLRPKAQGLH